jgi:hypothetical protein
MRLDSYLVFTIPTTTAVFAPRDLPFNVEDGYLADEDAADESTMIKFNPENWTNDLNDFVYISDNDDEERDDQNNENVRKRFKTSRHRGRGGSRRAEPGSTTQSDFSGDTEFSGQSTTGPSSSEVDISPQDHNRIVDKTVRFIYSMTSKCRSVLARFSELFSASGDMG